jgi:hypothetical protein
MFRGLGTRQAASNPSQNPRMSASPGTGPGSYDASHLRDQSTTGNSTPLSKLNRSTTLSQGMLVKYVWDNALSAGNLNLDVSGKIFLSSLERKFRPFKKKLNRSIHIIRFTPEMPIDEDDGYLLSLYDDSELESLWNYAKDYIKLKKTSKLLVMVEKDEGDPGDEL